MQHIPQKSYYKLSEVCQYADVQPYVLRFWESEFPQLRAAKKSGGQRAYTRASIELVRRIKQLLDEESRSISEARELLEQAPDPPIEADTSAEADDSAEPSPPVNPAAASDVLAAGDVPARAARSTGAPGSDTETVSRSRYEDALEEISHLRLRVQELEAVYHRARTRLEQVEDEAARHKTRADRGVDSLERVLDLLSR